MNIIQKKFAIINKSVCVVDTDVKWDHSGSDICKVLRNMIKDGSMKLLSSEYDNNYWNKEFSDPESTRTYAGCIGIDLNKSGDIEINVWDGDMCNGRRTEHRSKFVVQGKWWQVPVIYDAVENKFVRNARMIQKAQEDYEFEERCKMRERKLLEDFKEKQQ